MEETVEKLDELFPYQIKGASWLAEHRFRLLADEMGLGKSAQVVRACEKLDLRSVLIICPAVAQVNWKREFERWSKNTFFLKVVSYEHATKHFEELRKIPWSVLVLDESHYLKSIEAKRSKAVLGRNGIAQSSQRIWAVSGTPAPNQPAELWPLLRAFGLPVTYDEFVKKYCEVVDSMHGPKIVGANTKSIPELKGVLSKVMLRRKKEDVMKELPPIFFTQTSVEAGPVDLELEASFTQYVSPVDRRDELKQILEREQKAIDAITEVAGFTAKAMSALEGLAGSVSTLRRYTGLQKVQSAADMISGELEMGLYDKIVVFAIHRDVIEGLRVRLRKFKPVTLYGGTDPARRQTNIDKFQNSAACKVFIGNIMAAGTNITLTAAHHVTFVEQDWVPGNNAQAAMRCHRIGQSKPVTVRFLSLTNSVDDRIAKALRRKTAQLASIFDD